MTVMVTETSDVGCTTVTRQEHVASESDLSPQLRVVFLMETISEFACNTIPVPEE